MNETKCKPHMYLERTTICRLLMHQATMKLLGVLLGLLLVAAVRADTPAGDDEHEFSGGVIQFIGKAPKFVVSPQNGANGSFLRVDFGSLGEYDAEGRMVQVHSIQSLAAQTPIYTTGESVWSCVASLTAADIHFNSCCNAQESTPSILPTLLTF